MYKELRKYAPVGTTFCEGECLRKVVMTPEGPVVVCDGCKRVVIDNRNIEKDL
jgi:hypothetical protein